MRFPLVADDIDFKDAGDRYEIVISELLKTFLSDFGILEYEVEMLGVSSKSSMVEAFISTAIHMNGSDYAKQWVASTFSPYLIANHEKDIMVLKLAWEGRL